MRRARLTVAFALATVAAHPFVAHSVGAQSPDTTRQSKLAPPLIVPALYYTPETGVGGGVSALLVTLERNPAQRNDTYSAAIGAAVKGQFNLQIAADHWSAGNRWRFDGEVGAARFPNRFYGIGIAAPDSFERYTPTSAALNAGAQYAFEPGWYVGGRLGLDATSLSSLDSTRTITTYRERDGWKLVTLSASLTRDTRDLLYAPRSGSYTSIGVTQSARALGSEFAYTRWSFDWRLFRQLHEKGVLAVQLRNEAVFGTAPFDRLPTLGGQSALRGYWAGRYRDQSLALAQGELRVGPWFEGLLGATFFVGAGSVASSESALRDVPYRVTGGAGLRLILVPQTGMALRVDYGRARNSSGWYITVGEAF